MAAIKIQRFLGRAPKVSAELLPDMAAQIAQNTKMYSGDLVPYRMPKPVAQLSLGNTVVRTLYGLHDPDHPGDDSYMKWLHWASDVDIVPAVEESDTTVGFRGRFFYSGDGAPKISTYDMAPANYYDLGLPIASATLTTTPTTITVSNTSSFERDAANTAFIITSSAHGLKSGNIISVTGFVVNPSDDTDTTAKDFNVTNAEVTVLSSTKISYFSPGDAVSQTSNADGRVSLAGRTVPRAYVFTWVTPWDEESIPSEPTADVYVKEGQKVTVSGLPSTYSSAHSFIRGIRLYRTLVSQSGTDYFRLKTLWFPTALSKVARASGVSTVTLSSPHNFIEGDRFKISGCTDSSFDITGGVVTTVVNRMTFEYTQSGAVTAETAVVSGTLYHDAAETLDDAARYWGESTTNFEDDFDVRNVTIPLDSEDNDPPPTGLQGLVAVQNNILAGFVGTQVYFSEPGKPYAWPSKYAITFPTKVVAVIAVVGYTIVLTDDYPYRVSGSDPAIMTYSRIDTLYPCVSRRSVVNMGYGVVYATYGGLAVYDPTAGAALVTKAVHDWDTWEQEVDPSTFVATFYKGAYFASHNRGGLVFEREEKTGGYLVDTRYQFDAVWLDATHNKLYYLKSDQGTIYQWDDPEQPLLPMEWKSKVIVTPEYMNAGAARVIADNFISEEELLIINQYNAEVRDRNAPAWAAHPELGTINSFLINECLVNGDPYLEYPLPLPTSLPITFRLWVNKELVFQAVISSSDIFRLPSGYRSDTFEVGVSGSARVRAIHLGETPYGLRTV